MNVLRATLVLALTVSLHAGDWRKPMPSGAWPLAGYDPAIAGHDDLEPLRAMIGDAEIVALGETYHTSAGFYLMKHRIFRFLVEEMGFRAFAMETNWEGALITEQYVNTCGGTPEAAIARHINVWQSTEYAQFVRWMCEWNQAHPDDRISFFGFDIQQPREDGPALIDFLQRIGIARSDRRSQNIHQCENVSQSHPFGEVPPERHAACLEALGEIETHFEVHREEIVRRTSQRDFDVAMLRLVGLKAWEECVFFIRDEFEKGFNFRDAGMAYAFHAMRAMKAPGKKTVVWAANVHVARAELPRGERPIGSYLEDFFGDDYVTFALAAYEAEIDFPGFGCGIRERAPGGVEERLGRFGQKAMLVDTRGPLLRRANYMMGINEVRPWNEFDGIIFLQHSPKMNPLVWAPCR